MPIPKPFTLTINLVGRICLVRRRKRTWALFLKAPRSKSLNTRRDHTPLLKVSLARVATQIVADKAVAAVGEVTVVPTNELADSVGLWRLAGCDMTLRGVAPGTGGQSSLATVADLNAIVETVQPGSKFQPGILSSDPRDFGIAARLKLPRSADLSAFAANTSQRTFEPGGHQQVLSDFVQCRVQWANNQKAPALVLRRFGSQRRPDTYRFTPGADLTFTMSNLCTCVEQATPLTSSGTEVSEDREFVVYYSLLVNQLPANLRPVPQVPVIIGGIESPECYRPSQVDM